MNWNVLWEKIKTSIARIDPFALGPSGVFYYCLIFYLAPVLSLFGLFNNYPIHDSVARTALFYLTLGLAAFIIAYMTTGRMAPRLPRLFTNPWHMERMPFVFGITFFIGLVIKIIRIVGGGYVHDGKAPTFTGSRFYSAIGLFDWMSLVALVLAFATYWYLKKTNDTRVRAWGIVAWSAGIIELLYAMPSCNRTAIIMPVLLVLLVRFYVVKIKYVQLAMALVVLGIAIFPLGIVCRNITSVKAYLAGGIDTLEMARPGHFIANSVITRTNLSLIFLELVRRPMPLLRGQSLWNILVSLGPPRFIWSSKPVINAGGNELGHRLGLVSPYDFTTNIGPTIVGDWYLNFGWLGIVVGMAITGFLWRLLYELLIKGSGRSLSGIFIYSMLWVQLIKGMEDWIAPVTAGIIKLLVIMLVIHWILAFTSSKKNEPRI